VDWLVVGLGNPGAEYECTPHNLGFLAVDRFAERNGLRVTRKEAMALVGLKETGGGLLLAAKPQTYMNVSGPSVRELMRKYEMGLESLLLVYDELAFPWGEIRLRPKGSAGGHNGVESVIRAVGSQEFARVRMGVNPGHPLTGGRDKDFLLSPLRREWKRELETVVDRAAEAIEAVLAEGVEKAMTRFNRRAPGEKEEKE
jgi:PTH1 family peptidyl-tRNA hydrolase